MLCHVMFVRNAACERVRGSFAQLFYQRNDGDHQSVGIVSINAIATQHSSCCCCYFIALLGFNDSFASSSSNTAKNRVVLDWIGFDFLISMIGSIFSRMYHMANCTWWFVNVAKALAGVSNWLFIKHCRTQTWIRWAHDLLCVCAVCLFLALYPSFYIHYFI